MKNARLIVGICGASGALYGATLLKELLRHPVTVHAVLSTDGRKVMGHELKFKSDLPAFLRQTFAFTPHRQARLLEHPVDSFFTPPASGSFRHDGMVIAPCSVKTLAAIAAGVADNLITRAADICLKERRPLILVPRETPLSRIHLQNMLRLTEAGATILPPAPAFYFHPQTVQEMVDFVVARILDQLNLSHTLVKEWGHETI